MKGGLIKNFALLSALLFSGARQGTKNLSEAELGEFAKQSSRQRGNDRGDKFYNGLSFKRVKGKWTVKR